MTILELIYFLFCIYLIVNGIANITIGGNEEDE